MSRSFESKLKFVINMHNALRWMYPAPRTPQAHFVNENTILRLAAMMEGEELKGRTLKPEGPLSDDATRGEVSVRVLFLFRNLILHADGRLALRAKHVKTSQRDAYRRFCEGWGLTCQQEGETLCLDATRVMVPLATGCREYYLQLRRNRRGGVR